MDIHSFIEAAEVSIERNYVRPDSHFIMRRVIDELETDAAVGIRKLALGPDREGYTVFFNRKGHTHAEIHVMAEVTDITVYHAWVLAPHSTKHYIGTSYGWERHPFANPSSTPEMAAVKGMGMVVWMEAHGMKWGREPIDIRAKFIPMVKERLTLNATISLLATFFVWNLAMDMATASNKLVPFYWYWPPRLLIAVSLVLLAVAVVQSVYTYRRYAKD